MSEDSIIAELNRRWYERCAELRLETDLDVDGCPRSGRTVRERVQTGEVQRVERAT